MAFYLKQSYETEGQAGGRAAETGDKNHPAERGVGNSITLECNHSQREEERPPLHIMLQINTRAIDREERGGGRRRGGESIVPLRRRFMKRYVNCRRPREAFRAEL